MIAALEKRKREEENAPFMPQIPSLLKYGLSITLSLDDFPHDVLKNPTLLEYRVKHDKQIMVMKLSEAMKMKKLTTSFAAQVFSNEEQKTFFTIFHHANVRDSICIFIPDNYAAEKQLVITAEQRNACSLGSLFIFVGKNSTVTIMNDTSSTVPGKNYRSNFLTIVGESSAHITYITLQNSSSTSYNHTMNQAQLSDHATLQWIDCQLGGALNLIETSTFLDGEGSSLQTNNLFLGDDAQRFDVLTRGIHRARNTSTNFMTRCALDDAAKALVRGLIRIEPTAAHSEGYQKADVLLLGKEAQADPIPELEINNNDVKCTHGATVSRVNAENLFYLRSRGLSIDEATQAIVEGFFAPIVDTIPVTEFRAQIITALDNKYGRKHEIGPISV